MHMKRAIHVTQQRLQYIHVDVQFGVLDALQQCYTRERLLHARHLLEHFELFVGLVVSDGSYLHLQEQLLQRGIEFEADLHGAKEVIESERCHSLLDGAVSDLLEQLQVALHQHPRLLASFSAFFVDAALLHGRKDEELLEAIVICEFLLLGHRLKQPENVLHRGKQLELRLLFPLLLDQIGHAVLQAGGFEVAGEVRHVLLAYLLHGLIAFLQTAAVHLRLQQKFRDEEALQELLLVHDV